MDETLWYKFTQHSDLKHMLLATGDAELVEVCGVVICEM
jgi:diaminohydroxyphosphoribosylaminopyrimidine deaminase/5-amino-6-(5-phosphoribosylamino)uracil reductase